MSPLARASPAAFRAALKRAPRQTRSFGLHHTNEHTTHQVRTALSPRAPRGVRENEAAHLRALPLFLQNMPFTYDNRRKFATRYAGAAVTFFAVPFIAAGYQM